MNEEQIMDALNHLDDSMIERVEQLRAGKSKRKIRRLKWIAAAAGFVLAIGCFALWQNLPEPAVQSPDVTDSFSEQASGSDETVSSYESSVLDDFDYEVSGEYMGEEATDSEADSDIFTNSGAAQSTVTAGNADSEESGKYIIGKIISWQADGFTVLAETDLASDSADGIKVELKENAGLKFVDKSGAVFTDTLPTENSLPIGSRVQIKYEELSQITPSGNETGGDGTQDEPNSDFSVSTDGEMSAEGGQTDAVQGETQYVIYPIRIVFIN